MMLLTNQGGQRARPTKKSHYANEYFAEIERRNQDRIFS